MNSLPISCFIIAKNEADRIAATIASVKDLVSQIVVIDSGSTDNTMAVAEGLGCKVFYNEWQGFGLQKRFGEEQCQHHWLLNLDADEVPTPALIEEIRNLFKNGEPQLSGYYLPVRDLLPGEKKLAPFAHTNYCLRLYDRRKARFSESPVHDSVIVQSGETARLQQPVLHYSFRSIAHMVEKLNALTTDQAANAVAQGKNIAIWRLLTELPVNFLKAYFLRGYILRGWQGFTLSVLHGYVRFMRIAKYFEMTRWNRRD